MNLADLYSALADPTRLRVLELLHEKARPVHELAGAFDISRPAISRHLRVLKEAGLVQELKQGRENLYSFQRDELKAGLAWLEEHQGRAKTRRIAKPKPVAEIVVAPAPEPAPVAKPKAAAKPKVAAKPRDVVPPKAAAKPKAPKPAPVATPPTPAPQLSFFDL